MLGFAMLSVVMLNVVAPISKPEYEILRFKSQNFAEMTTIL